ncbi:hypothetical protein [Treponema sp.]|uniref:hypothetical protein n=1 Tax=Treponema sp. TaxID=166 RepID=UPI00257E4250|nr:hypothetical protein [Treponema sp.]MBE6353896.1 hypothetical protein [Treponema sp.]
MLLKKSCIYNILIQSLALLVFIPGRFAYALLILLAYNFFILTGTLIRKLILILHLEELQIPISVSTVITSAILFKQFLNLYSPLSSFVLSFALYIAATCSFIVTKLYIPEIDSLKKELTANFTSAGSFTVFGLCFALFRDIFGYGTVSFPCPSGIFELVISRSTAYASGIFWASVPGADIMLAVTILVYSLIYDKFIILKKVED